MTRVGILGVLIMMCVMCHHASAQKELGIFNALSVGVSAGTTGVGIDVATPVTPYFAVRGGVSFMPGFHINTDVDVDVNDPNYGSIPTTLDMTGSMTRTSGELLVNYYPFLRSSFFVTAGAYFGGSKLVKIDAHSDALKEYVNQGGKAGIVIGNQTIPVDKDGNIAGGLEVSGFRPYLGLGFGRAVPQKRIGVMFELGVQFHGRPDVYTDAGVLGSTSADGDDSFTKIMDKLTVYPVMKIRLCGRLF